MTEDSQSSSSLAAMPTLINFIEHARSQGASDEVIMQLLRSRGWSKQEVEAAYTQVYERLTGLTLPTPTVRAGESARDAFLYLLSFATLGIWTQALGQIGFIAIDQLIPDTLNRNYGSPGYLLAASIARLIIVFPIYLLLMRMITQDLERHPDQYRSGVRVWLTYLALLIAALIAIVDLIIFLTSLLQGELTLRFTGKVIIVFLIAGGVFWYYLSWLQQRPKAS